MMDQDDIQDELVALLQGSSTFLTASVRVNDFEYPVKTGVSKAPYAIFGTGGFSTDGCAISFRIPLTILTRYGILPYKTAMDNAQEAQAAVIAVLASHGRVLELAGDEPVELDDDHLGHEFIIQQITLTAGERS